MALRKTRTKHSIKASTAVATTYTYVSDPVDLVSGIRGEFAGFLLAITKDDATSLEFKLEVGDSDAVAATDSHWHQVTKATGAIDERTITAASLGTTDYIALFHDVNLTPYGKVRIKVKKTGGTGTVNVVTYAMFGGQS